MTSKLGRRAFLAAMVGAPVAAVVAPQAVAVVVEPPIQFVSDRVIAADIEHALLNAMTYGRGHFHFVDAANIQRYQNHLHSMAIELMQLTPRTPLKRYSRIETNFDPARLPA